MIEAGKVATLKEYTKDCEGGLEMRKKVVITIHGI